MVIEWVFPLTAFVFLLLTVPFLRWLSKWDAAASEAAPSAKPLVDLTKALLEEARSKIARMESQLETHTVLLLDCQRELSEISKKRSRRSKASSSQLRVLDVETHQRVVQAEKLRALGQLASGIAHDFNNMLQAILGYSQLIAQDPENTDLLKRGIETIQKAALDGTETVRRIRDFSRVKGTRPFEAVDLNQVVKEAVEVTQPRWKDQAQAEGISFEVKVDTTPILPVAGDPSGLRDALVNIVLNALDAMPEGGQLTLKTGVQRERVYCVIHDTGIGMTEEVKRRLFEPFFTTKGRHGTGLGLAITYGVVTRHGGEIEVESRVGQGSTFTIWLPVGQEIPKVPSSPAPVLPQSKAKILVIEDEEGIRKLLVDYLSAQGHTVVACKEGQSGLAQFRKESFDLVLTDLGMPGVSGWEVAKRIKELSPETPVALITGWAIDPDEVRLKWVDLFSLKPLNLKDIAAAIALGVAKRDSGKG